MKGWQKLLEHVYENIYAAHLIFASLRLSLYSLHFYMLNDIMYQFRKQVFSLMNTWSKNKTTAANISMLKLLKVLVDLFLSLYSHT